MSEASPILNLPYIVESQAQKEITHNEALNLLDVLTQATAVALQDAPPTETAADGTCYLVGATPTDAWAGKAGCIAEMLAGAWQFISPKSGWQFYVPGTGNYTYSGTAWVLAAAGAGATALSALTDVDESVAPTDGQSLVYNTAAGKWKPKTITGGSGGSGVGVQSAAVNGSGHLILTLTDSSTLDAGSVVGPQGATGATGTQGAVGATGATGATGAAGAKGDTGPQGLQGLQGLQGVGIAGATINGSGHLILTKTDSTTIDAGAVGSVTGATALSGLSDVDESTAPTDGQALVYNAAAGKWKPAAVSSGGSGTGSTVVAGGVVGSVSFFPAGLPLPAKHLSCSVAEGTTFDATTYSALYSLLGTNTLPYFTPTSDMILMICAG